MDVRKFSHRLCISCLREVRECVGCRGVKGNPKYQSHKFIGGVALVKSNNVEKGEIELTNIFLETTPDVQMPNTIFYFRNNSCEKGDTISFQTLLRGGIIMAPKNVKVISKAVVMDDEFDDEFDCGEDEDDEPLYPKGKPPVKIKASPSKRCSKCGGTPCCVCDVCQDDKPPLAKRASKYEDDDEEDFVFEGGLPDDDPEDEPMVEKYIKKPERMNATVTEEKQAVLKGNAMSDKGQIQYNKLLKCDQCALQDSATLALHNCTDCYNSVDMPLFTPKAAYHINLKSKEEANIVFNRPRKGWRFNINGKECVCTDTCWVEVVGETEFLDDAKRSVEKTEPLKEVQLYKIIFHATWILKIHYSGVDQNNNSKVFAKTSQGSAFFDTREKAEKYINDLKTSMDFLGLKDSGHIEDTIKEEELW